MFCELRNRGIEFRRQGSCGAGLEHLKPEVRAEEERCTAKRGDRCTRMCRFSVHAETDRRGGDVNVQRAEAPWKLESGVNELH